MRTQSIAHRSRPGKFSLQLRQIHITPPSFHPTKLPYNLSPKHSTSSSILAYSSVFLPIHPNPFSKFQPIPKTVSVFLVVLQLVLINLLIILLGELNDYLSRVLSNQTK